MSGKRLRDVPVCLWVSPEEMEAIQGRMAEAGIRNLSAYLRKMALNGYVLASICRLCGSLSPSNADVQTISIKWRSRPTPTEEFTRRRLRPYSGTMPSCGGPSPTC